MYSNSILIGVLFSFRFQLRLYEIKLGTLENASAADSEWALRPYMNTNKKRRFLSDQDGFEEDALKD